MNTSLHPLRHRALLAAGMWLCLCTGAWAVTLGPSTRSAVLGQPLDLSIQLMLDSGDDPQALCLEADVFYVDKPLDKASVRITPEKSATASDWLVHIRSATPVEGPVVTVHLRAGCVEKTIRRYVVLAATKTRALSAGTTAAEPGPAGATDGNKIKALEAELRQLRSDMLQNRAELAESRSQIEQAENSRFSKVLVYALAALCSIAVMGLLFLWHLRPSGRSARTDAAAEYGRFSPESGLSTGLPMYAVSQTADPEPIESLFDDLRRASRQPAPESLPPLAPRDRPRFSVSVPFVPRTVKVPELLDLQKQIELFSAQGQRARAIEVLRQHLVDNVKTSALVYLDLLDLYHEEGNVQSFEDLREDYNKVFDGQIPPFDRYPKVPAGDSVFDEILLRIQGAWPTRQALRIIEDVLFREPGKGAELLVLEEYRELLLLYAVARELINLESGASGGAGDTQWPDLSMQPRASPRLGLDIDLAQLSGGRDSKPAGALTVGRPPLPEGKRPGALSGLTKEPHTSVFSDSRRSGLPAMVQPKTNAPNSVNPSGLNSLVDFDDYDTGYRPDDFTKSKP